MFHTEFHTVDTIFRRRLALVVLLLLLCAAAAVCGHQLIQLKKSQKEAIEQSVPRLAKAQKLERSLVKIADISNQQNTNEVIQAISEYRIELDLQLSRIREIVEDGDFLSAVSAHESSLLRDQLDQLESLNYVASSTQISKLMIKAQIDQKMDNLSELRNKFKNIVEPLSLDIASQLGKSLNINWIAERNIPSTVLPYIKHTFDEQFALTELTYRISSLIDSLEQLPLQVDTTDSENLIKRIKFDFRNAAQLLIQYTQYRKNPELSKVVKDLRVMSVGGRGVSIDVNSMLSIDQQLAQYSTERHRLIKSISDIGSKIVRITERRIEESSQDFNKYLNRTVVFMISIGFFIAIVAASVNYYVVEKQINQRISKLTEAVLDIVAGKTSHASDISGDDEISAMAIAVDTFETHAKELRRSNQELEQFAYAASHDMRSPLRAIENLAQWTLEDAQDSLSADSKENLNMLLRQAKRLSTLQSDLLEYSKAGNPDNAIGQLDLKETLMEFSSLLDPESNYKIAVSGNIQYFSTYVVPLRQILLNFINNAMKHHDQKHGKITITSNLDNGRLNFTVADDGPGIDPQYHQQIFGLFKTLKSRDEVEGSGLGLSLINKLVERYGGKVTVSSNPALKRGTVFQFDWPIADRELSLGRAA